MHARARLHTHTNAQGFCRAPLHYALPTLYDFMVYWGFAISTVLGVHDCVKQWPSSEQSRTRSLILLTSLAHLGF